MKAFLRLSVATVTLIFSSFNSAAEVADGGSDLIARASVAFRGQATLAESPQRDLQTGWFAEDATYEYSAAPLGMLLSWHGEAAIHQHLHQRADRGEIIEGSNVMFFPTNDPITVFVQYETSGTRARTVVALIEMRGREIVKLRKFARAETIVDILLAGQRFPDTALLQD